MLEIILIVVAAIIAVFLVVVATRPSEFSVTRSGGIAAPASTVFPHVNDLPSWEAWSPWAKLDPDAKSTFEGPRAGAGAVMGWAGNHQVGEGRMTITESRPNELIRIKLEFFKPLKAINTATFAFRPDGNRTVVTWTLSGTNSFVSKAVGLFIDCEKRVGGQFEQGLANMKAAVESAPRGNS